MGEDAHVSPQQRRRSLGTTPPERRRSSRESFVATTAKLLRRKGYAATGLNEIVARSGAPKGSLYFHFPGGKEELAVAAMARAGGRLQTAIGEVLSSSEDLGEALARLVDALATGLQASGYEDGCPIATVALEVANESEEMREAAAAAFGSWLDVLAARLVPAGFDQQAARRRALLILACLEGGLLLARAQRDLEPLTAVREELRLLSA